MLTNGGLYEFTMRMIQNNGWGCISEWSAPATVTVKQVEIPPFFTTDCDEANVGTFRTVMLPVVIHSGNPLTYAVTFADAAYSSFNYAGSIVDNTPWGSYIEVHLPLPAGDYELEVDIDGCQLPTIGRVLVDDIALGGASLIEQRWNDVLTVNNNPTNNGGFTFYAYQWYKDDMLIPGAIKQYYTEPSGRLNGAYHVALDGYAIVLGVSYPVSYVSCPFIPSAEFSMAVSLYPIPVAMSQPLTFSTTLSAEELAGARLEVYDILGGLQRTITGLSPEMTITGFSMPGVYVGRLVTQSRGVAVIKFIVQ
jgi:hypothetical protein